MPFGNQVLWLSKQWSSSQNGNHLRTISKDNHLAINHDGWVLK